MKAGSSEDCYEDRKVYHLFGAVDDSELGFPALVVTSYGGLVEFFWFWSSNYYVLLQVFVVA